MKKFNDILMTIVHILERIIAIVLMVVVVLDVVLLEVPVPELNPFALVTVPPESWKYFPSAFSEILFPSLSKY